METSPHQGLCTSGFFLKEWVSRMQMMMMNFMYTTTQTGKRLRTCQGCKKMGWAAGGAAFLRRAVVQPMAGAFERAFPNRANHGLYAGKEIGFGNKVSFSQRKFVSPPSIPPVASNA